MSYTEELQRLLEAKASMRQSIINKGVEVPEDAAIETYGDYIRQIITPPPIDPSNPTFEGLKLALATDDPASYFPVGTEIPDKHAGNDNPLIVAQYLNETNNSSYGGAVGVILVRKYVDPISQMFGSSVDYASSTIKNFLDTTYLDGCSANLKDAITEISTPYRNTTVKSKMFLMSTYEVCSGDSSVNEGVMWDYWKQKTGLSAPNRGANSGRIVRDMGGAAQTAWLRSYGPSTMACFISANGGTDVDRPSVNHGILPACFIAKD